MNDHALVLRWQQLCQRIQDLAQSYPAEEPRKLLAVSKYASIDAVRVLHQAGQLDFAENYLQPALKKISALAGLPIIWHFIGSLQGNKCVEIAQHFSWVHSLTQAKHALLLAQARQNQEPLQVCLQVNFSKDHADRNGVLPEALPSLIETILPLPSLHVRGLMVFPKAGMADDFVRLARLRDELEKQFQIRLPTLSMGVSSDYAEAIAAGATIVRIGSILFQDP